MEKIALIQSQRKQTLILNHLKVINRSSANNLPAFHYLKIANKLYVFFTYRNFPM